MRKNIRYCIQMFLQVSLLLIGPLFERRGIGTLVGEPIGGEAKPGPEFIEQGKALGKKFAESV